MKQKFYSFFALALTISIIVLSCRKSEPITDSKNTLDQEQISKEMTALIKQVPKIVQVNLAKRTIEQIYSDGNKVLLTNAVRMRKPSTVSSIGDSVKAKISFDLLLKGNQTKKPAFKGLAGVSEAEEASYPGAGESQSIAHVGFGYSTTSSGYIKEVYSPWVTLDPNSYWTTQNGTSYRVVLDVSGVHFDPYPTLPQLHPEVIVGFNVFYFFYREGSYYTGSSMSTYYAHATL